MNNLKREIRQVTQCHIVCDIEKTAELSQEHLKGLVGSFRTFCLLAFETHEFLNVLTKVTTQMKRIFLIMYLSDSTSPKTEFTNLRLSSALSQCAHQGPSISSGFIFDLQGARLLSVYINPIVC